MNSNNIRFLLSELSVLSDLVRTYEYSQLGSILLREMWLHKDIDDGLIQLSGFTGLCVVRLIPQRERAGGIIICHVESIFRYSDIHINSSAIKCNPTV